MSSPSPSPDCSRWSAVGTGPIFKSPLVPWGIRSVQTSRVQHDRAPRSYRAVSSVVTRHPRFEPLPDWCRVPPANPVTVQPSMHRAESVDRPVDHAGIVARSAVGEREHLFADRRPAFLATAGR